jgi:hypothetical protein
MPALRSPKHELFAQNIATAPKTGMSIAQAYIASGYAAREHAAESNASRLLKKAEVQARIAELVAPAARKTRATVDTLAQQFDAVFDGAMGSAQFGAAGSAAAAKAKLLGFMRERLEVGSPGEYRECQTSEEAVDALIERAGDVHAVLDLLRKMTALVEARVASQAMVVDAKPKSTTSEAEAARELFHGKRR